MLALSRRGLHPRGEIRWTGEHEAASISGMTLILALRTVTGELVVAADRRSTAPLETDEAYGKLVLDEKSSKLIDFDGAVLGVAGKVGTALYVIRDFIASDERDKDSCERLSERLKTHYEERYTADFTKWPTVQVTYCDWHGGRGRILRMASHGNFDLEEVDIEVHASGKGGMAATLYFIFGTGESTVAHAERFCLLAITLTAAMDTSVGGGYDVWVLNEAGLVKRSQNEIETVLTSVNEATKTIRQQLYP